MIAGVTAFFRKLLTMQNKNNVAYIKYYVIDRIIKKVINNISFILIKFYIFAVLITIKFISIMKLMYTIQVENAKEMEVLVFLLMRDSRITSDTQSSIFNNHTRFYHIYKGANYQTDGKYTVLGANENNKGGKLYTITEYIKL